MTFFSGSVTEVIYNMPAPGAVSDANTTSNLVLTGNTATNPPFQIPTPLWQPSYAVARLFKVVARGCWTQLGSGTPTLILTLGLSTTQGTLATTLASTGAMAYTASTAVANGTFTLDCDITVTAVGQSSHSPQFSVYASGTVFTGPANNAATGGGLTYGLGQASSGGPPAVPSTVSFNPYTVQYLELFGTNGVNSASDSVTCTQFTVYGCN